MKPLSYQSKPAAAAVALSIGWREEGGGLQFESEEKKKNESLGHDRTDGQTGDGLGGDAAASTSSVDGTLRRKKKNGETREGVQWRFVNWQSDGRSSKREKVEQGNISRLLSQTGAGSD